MLENKLSIGQWVVSNHIVHHLSFLRFIFLSTSFCVSVFITSIIIFYPSLTIKMFLILQVLPLSKSPPYLTRGLGCQQGAAWCVITSWGSTRTASEG